MGPMPNEKTSGGGKEEREEVLWATPGAVARPRREGKEDPWGWAATRRAQAQGSIAAAGACKGGGEGQNISGVLSLPRQRGEGVLPHPAKKQAND